jgi:modulator of FtsH protease
METSVVSGWSDFLVAAAGTAGALAGLLFVAISINLSRIIELPGVSGRAAESIILLSATLSEALTALIPRLPATKLGWALALIAVPAWLAPAMIQIESIRARTYLRPSHVISRILLHQVAALPGVMAALSLCGVLPGGMLWLGLGVLTSMLVAIGNAWILLVEILR